MKPPQETAADKLAPWAPKAKTGDEEKPGLFKRYWWIIVPVGAILLI
jgi:hypothetical protein